MYKFNFILFCKTYKGDFNRFKILKNSIDIFNQDKISFYISCPKSDVELFKSLKTGKENYDYNIVTDEEVLNCDASKQDWNTQQFVKVAFSDRNIAKFYLIIDSDSYFTKNFYISDFMYDSNTPYIVMHEGKYFKEICSILNDKNIFDLGKKIKNYFNRCGKNYQFLTTPIVFSSEILKNLNKIDKFENLFKISPLEAYWHGEFLLHSNIIPYKSCEPFFKCFNYQLEYNFWKDFGELENDINQNYLGIVMQNRWVKSPKFKNTILDKTKRKIIKLKHYIYSDRAHLKKSSSYYIKLITGFFKVLFKK